MKKPHESGADILVDQRRVPTVWSRLTAGKADDGKGNPKPPEVSVLFDQPNIQSSKSLGAVDGKDVGIPCWESTTVDIVTKRVVMNVTG